jgi:hypothetical protein
MDESSDEILEFEYTQQLSDLSIRLLSFNESKDDELNWSLEVFSFPGAPPYHALSYTWGSPYDFPNLELRPGEEEGWMARRLIDQHKDVTKEIVLNGRTMEVGLSIFEALERLSTGLEDGPMQHKYLWADAICINQKDNEEKMKQVLLMGDIYKQASSVIAWLGNPLDETRLALEVISEIGKIDIGQLEEMKRLSHDDPSSYTKLGIRHITEREWRAFCGFSRRNWFSRIWIVQESFFARELVLVIGRAATIFKMGLAYVSFLLWQSSWADAIL